MKFGAVGVLSIGIYFLLLYLLRPMIGPIWILTTVAYALSMLFNFLAQSMFTFQVHAKDIGMVRRYICMQAGCMFFNSAMMFVLVDVFAFYIWRSQVGVTSFIAASSFLMSKYWVFSKP